jgi:hypothetical protein
LEVSVRSGTSAAASGTEVEAVVVLVVGSMGEVEVSPVGSEGGGTGVVFDSVAAMAAGVSMLFVTCVESVICVSGMSGRPRTMAEGPSSMWAEEELELTMEV